MSEVQLSERNLEATFGVETVKNGRRYHLEGRVVEALAEAEERVSGLVQGTDPEPYEVEISLQRERFGVEIKARCSCQVSFNCKHAVAVLYHVFGHNASGTGERAPAEIALRGWLEDLSTLVKQVTPASTTPEDLAHITYVLQTGADGETDVPHVKVFKVRDANSKVPYDPADVLQDESSVRLTPGDRELLYELADLGYRPQHGLALDGMLGAALLGRMLNTGRCTLGEPDGPALRRGSPRKLALDWAMNSDTGQFAVALQTEPHALRVLPFTPPWYVDAKSGECGPVATSLPRALSEELLAAPVLDASLVSSAVETLGELLTPYDLRVGTPPRVRQLDNPSFCSHLVFASNGEDVARLQFDYDGYRADPNVVAERTIIRLDDEFVVVARDSAKEQRAARMLATLGLKLVPPAADSPGFSTWRVRKGTGWPTFLVESISVLKAEGWDVSFEPGFGFRLLEPSRWRMHVTSTGRGDMYDVDLLVDDDGTERSLLRAVAQYLVDHDSNSEVIGGTTTQHAVALDDGTVVPADDTKLALVKKVFADLAVALESIADGQPLRVPRFQSALLLELDAPQLGLKYDGDRAFASLGRRIASFRGIREMPSPPGLGIELRPYQRQALGWLDFLGDINSGGCLADDMGLGKTAQTLAHLLAEKLAGRADRPTLVVAPTSVLGNWLREAGRVTPQLKVLLLHGPRRHLHFDSIAEYDLCITSYALLPRDEKQLAKQPFHIVVLDEAQHIKNPRTRAAIVTRRIETRRTLALTGTPMENHLGELWALFSVLVPGLLGSEEGFRKIFRRPIEREDDSERAHALARRLAPFMLRRTKAAVAPELPPRTEIVHTVGMGNEQSTIYERVRADMDERLRRVLLQGSVEDARVEILSALLRLRQVCCDPRLIEEGRGVHSSAKLDFVMELVPTLLDAGRRILIFSQFTSMLALIEEKFREAEIDYLKLTGETRDRQALVDRFQSGDAPVFLISLKAGGTGLNLTAADTVIHYDPWWNPAAQAQASDRAHRIGQTQPVFVHKLLSEGTVEERIFTLQSNKQRLADGLFTGRGESGLEWTAEQLTELLAPVSEA